MREGDGVADIDIQALMKFHHSHGKLATVTSVLPLARFGRLEFDQDLITGFKEKPPLRKSRMVVRAGSMAGSMCCNARRSITSPAMKRSGSVSPLNGSLRTTNSWAIGTTASGPAWIPCGKRITWKSCGSPRRPIGRSGKKPCDRIFSSSAVV
jgi:hypothetical protein